MNFVNQGSKTTLKGKKTMQINHTRPLIGLTALYALNPTHAAGINDTGITTCSNETQNGLPCPVTLAKMAN